jgi:TRAP-type C4-dicarboxylate transport system permease large subunit
MVPNGVNRSVAARASWLSIKEISVGVLPLMIPYIAIIFLLVYFSGWVTNLTL